MADDYPFDLGTYGRTVGTASEAAQLWFDRGLTWTWAYNHQEAAACFGRAAAADPSCAMARWGGAYALGPNYNLPWHLWDPRGRARALAGAYAEMEAALALREGASEPERALIEALPARYQAATPVEDMDPWNDAFADAMRRVHARFPEDLDVTAVLAEALMNRTPWRMWNLATGAAAEGADTGEAQALLEAAFARDPAAWEHPGLLHLYVHLMEMSPTPERALPQGDVLRTLVPGAGHLIHMPTHLDVQCGAYGDTVTWNERAIEADALYRDHAGHLNYYTAYRIHNYHFAIYGAMFAGQYGAAMRAAEGLERELPAEVLAIESPPMADFLEGYVPMKQHVLVRFGRWEEILGQALPADPDLYTATTAMMLYARGVAASALGRIEVAEAAREDFLAARARVSRKRRVHNNTVQDLLGVAEAMLEGELAYRKAQHDAAFGHLRRAVALDDALPYDEPWGWMQPPRHALGALLLEQGDAAGAEAVYRQDLGLDPGLPRSSWHLGNLWALRGLLECLRRRGESAEARHVELQLRMAQARADVPVTVSCFCARAA